jgi:hypothetical protein
MGVCAVGDDLSILVGQHLRSEFLDLFGWDVQGSGDMGFTIAFRCERLDHRDLFPSSFDFSSFVEIVLAILISKCLILIMQVAKAWLDSQQRISRCLCA